MDEIDADVCVVGAGYAGLTAARRLRGGRQVASSCSKRAIASAAGSGRSTLADGTPVDRGGAWLGPKHDAIFGLAREVGVSTYKTWVKGAHLLVDGERTRRYTGLIPEDQPARRRHDRARAGARSTGWRSRSRSTRRGPRSARRSGTR